MLAVFMAIESDDERSLAEHLYLTYKSKMYAVAYAVLANREDAQDAVMDAVYNIVRNISLFSAETKRKNESLIMIIIRNAAINRYNSNSRRNHLPLDDAADSIAADELLPDEAYIESENYEELLANIRRLDPIYRDVILLKYLYEYDNSAIADIVGVTETTVRVRLMRGRKLLKKLLKEGCVGE